MGTRVCKVWGARHVRRRVCQQGACPRPMFLHQQEMVEAATPSLILFVSPVGFKKPGSKTKGSTSLGGKEWLSVSLLSKFKRTFPQSWHACSFEHADKTKSV